MKNECGNYSATSRRPSSLSTPARTTMRAVPLQTSHQGTKPISIRSITLPRPLHRALQLCKPPVDKRCCWPNCPPRRFYHGRPTTTTGRSHQHRARRFQTRWGPYQPITARRRPSVRWVCKLWTIPLRSTPATHRMISHRLRWPKPQGIAGSLVVRSSRAAVNTATSASSATPSQLRALWGINLWQM